MLVDLHVDLDVNNPRDYPYLAYFGDPDEWMILVRQPHCWRFLCPLKAHEPEPTPEQRGDKARRFIGDVTDLRVVGTNIYTVHHRVATRWSADRRVFLMGDAAHLITPMWALGLNTGVLDASNLPWRLAWVKRGWADETLLDGYEREQRPVATQGSGEMAEQARRYMARQDELTVKVSGDWGTAVTRMLLGVRLDISDDGDWSMIKEGEHPDPVRVGDRLPDMQILDGRGQTYLHQFVRDSFAAFYSTDARRAPRIPARTSPALRRALISRWDAPLDSGLRDRALFDPGDRVRERLGLDGDRLVLVRPDGHIAAIELWDRHGTHDRAAELYRDITGRDLPDDEDPKDQQ